MLIKAGFLLNWTRLFFNIIADSNALRILEQAFFRDKFGTLKLLKN